MMGRREEWKTMAHRLINIDEVIATAFTYIDSEDTRDEILFENWAWDALRSIGPTRVDKKSVCLPVDDRCITKPTDFIYAIDMNILDACDRIHYFQYSESGWLESEQSSRNQNFSTFNLNGTFRRNHIKITETPCTFELSIQADCEQIVKAELLYYHYPLDDFGKMLIQEDLKDAITTYIEFCYYKMIRNKTRGGAKNNSVPMSEVDWYYEKWRRLRSEARGRSKMPDPLAMDTITRKWVTGIPNYQNKFRHRGFGSNFNRFF